MLPHQLRVISEKAELDSKLRKLEEFTQTPTFSSLPLREQVALKAQMQVMLCYSSILGERIANFN